MILKYLGALIIAALLASSVSAQQKPPEQPRTPRATAPIDLTGNWVSVVTEEWRWRMLTPFKGDYTSIPLSEEGRRVADTWETSKDGSCQAYGAGGLMRLPTRVRISWDNDATLKVETDAGQQTRLLRFDTSRAGGARSLQGFSVAGWEPIGGAAVVQVRNGARVGGAPPQGGALKVVTTNLLEGWLRKNGAPYSEETAVTEYWDRVTFPNDDIWLVVTTIVDDPKYLLKEYTTSSHFKREPDGSKWHPTSCR